jgi:hypothetical protein
VDAALATLAAGGRVRLGSDVTVGALGPGASVVFPPADPARMGALDRALDQRGVTWRFGGVVESPAPTDSGAWVGRVAVARRHRLVPRGSGRTGVLATVGGEPWIVRSGDVVLVGSRLEPSWTAAPLEAGFVSLVDALANRSVRGELAALAGAAGDAVPLPDRATEVRQGDARWTVEGGSAFVPPRPGVYWLLAGRDTIGALAAGSDPRESALAPADPAAVRRLWPGARVAPLDGIAAAAFTLSARADLRGALLWLALLLGAAELLVAAGGGARRA